jgi:hypothetical protein
MPATQYGGNPVDALAHQKAGDIRWGIVTKTEFE